MYEHMYDVLENQAIIYCLGMTYLSKKEEMDQLVCWEVQLKVHRAIL